MSKIESLLYGAGAVFGAGAVVLANVMWFLLFDPLSLGLEDVFMSILMMTGYNLGMVVGIGIVVGEIRNINKARRRL